MKKHRRTKATDITPEVRQAVAIRDNGRCIYCGKVVPVSCSNAHFIKRSQRWLRNTRECCYIMSRMSLGRRFWIELQGLRRFYRKVFERLLWRKLEKRKFNL